MSADISERKAKPIALVPIGQVDRAILTTIGWGLREAFGRAYVISAPLSHPDYAYDRRREQYRSDDILAQLRHLSLPAERWLGVVDVDLYTSGLNFIFGQATMGGPAALIALPRLRQSFYGLPEDGTLYHERAVKEAVHELGHTYGLGHCRNPRCVMSFSNSLRDVDRKERDFCPSCRRKLPLPALQ
jgi:archaemetzincin